MATPTPQKETFPAETAPDSVCGGPVVIEGANQFYDGGVTRYFCSAMCRRLYIDAWRATEGWRVSPGASGRRRGDTGSKLEG